MPTLEGARRAARALADEHGVAQVLLYGSVATGEARPGSDLDLVAVFDDLGDYRRRWKLRQALTATAMSAAGCDVDVRVTDRPEWRQRSQHVRNSIEHHIARYAITLIDSPARGVNWHKEIGMPGNARGEAERHLKSMSGDMANLAARYVPDRNEVRAGIAPDAVEDVSARRRARFQALCADGALCVEHGLKALVALGDAWPIRTHEPGRLMGQMPEPRRKLADVVQPHLLEDIAVWREAGSYEADLEAMQLADEELRDVAAGYVDAALALSAEVISEYERIYPEPSRVTVRLAEDCRSVLELKERITLWDGSEIGQ